MEGLLGEMRFASSCKASCDKKPDLLEGFKAGTLTHLETLDTVKVLQACIFQGSYEDTLLWYAIY